MDFTRLTQGEKIAGVSGIALILIMFIFKWFGLEVSGSAGGFAFGRARLAQRMGLVRLHRHRPVHHGGGRDRAGADQRLADRVGLPVAASAIVAGLGILSVVLIIISIISPPDFGADCRAPASTARGRSASGSG